MHVACAADRICRSKREAGIAAIGRWFAKNAQSGKIIEGRRLGRRTKTVRLGRVRKRDLPMVSDGPFIEAKESVGSYTVVEVKDELFATWPLRQFIVKVPDSR